MGRQVQCQPVPLPKQRTFGKPIQCQLVPGRAIGNCAKTKSEGAVEPVGAEGPIIKAPEVVPTASTRRSPLQIGWPNMPCRFDGLGFRPN
jgi:hypothetical protein